MLTKEMFAKTVCRNWAINNNRKDGDYESMVGDIYASTSLGIALEVLGVITPEKHADAYNYLSDRGGFATVYVDEKTGEIYSLSTREVYDLLPDHLYTKEEEGA